MFDSVDVIFDLPGYIAGYGVSPDSRCNRTLPQKHIEYVHPSLSGGVSAGLLEALVELVQLPRELPARLVRTRTGNTLRLKVLVQLLQPECV